MTNDKAVIPDLLAWLVPNSLLVFDLGYSSFPFFDALTDHRCWFANRLRTKTRYQVQRGLINQPRLRERIVKLGKYCSNPSRHPVRLIEVYVGKGWYRYVTNVLDPQQLSVLEVVSLYERRWQIETTFLLVKRLLHLAYLWVGSLNGVRLHVQATFLFYALLIDLCDEVADQLQLPLERNSVEMVYGSLYFYTVAVAEGYSKSAPEHLAEEAHGLGIIKRQRPRAGPNLEEQIRRALTISVPPPGSRMPTSFDLTSPVLS